ncbi:MAG: hypothetical protein AAGE01_04060 [Pseudomonadota bacterium]
MNGRRLLPLALAAATTLALSACAGKRDITYVGQCAIPGHWFCGKTFDTRSECNNARKRHDYETSLTGSCFSGDPRGRPDTRTM